MTTATQTGSLISTLPGNYYTDPTIFAMEQDKVFEIDVVLRDPRRRTRQARRLQDGSGRAGERAAYQLAPKVKCGRTSTCAGIVGAQAVHRGER